MGSYSLNIERGLILSGTEGKCSQNRGSFRPFLLAPAGSEFAGKIMTSASAGKSRAHSLINNV